MLHLKALAGNNRPEILATRYHADCFWVVRKKQLINVTPSTYNHRRVAFIPHFLHWSRISNRIDIVLPVANIERLDCLHYGSQWLDHFLPQIGHEEAQVATSLQPPQRHSP